MANDERYVQIRLNDGEIEALKQRAVLNMRPMAAEGAMIVKLVLAGRGETVTVPGVNELNFLGRDMPVISKDEIEQAEVDGARKNLGGE